MMDNAGYEEKKVQQRQAEHDVGTTNREGKTGMKTTATPEFAFIGWDVGGWNCDKNSKSRDAVVILDSSMDLVGQPWRGNLRKCIGSAVTTREWLAAIFNNCGAKFPGPTAFVTMAIDTPLGFPEEFVDLVAHRHGVEPDEVSGRNCYLYRHTERRLFDRGLSPLSTVKDMIGSQATKGMHMLTKFAPIAESCGVWTDGAVFRAIETYPTACRETSMLQQLLSGRNRLKPPDVEDARTCALIAYLFGTARSTLETPDSTVPHSEGWIWVPKL
jgi:hypothetical protein